MNTKTLLMLPLLLLLVLVTPTVAHATNESSYKTGYNGAINVFRCLAAPRVSNDCDGQGYSFNQYDVCTTSAFKPVDNMTACADGYANGFVHWCASDIYACSKQVRADAIPHMMDRNGTVYGYHHENYTQSKGCESTNMTAYWFNNICHHQPPPRAVVVTGPSHCYTTKEGETCESGGWIPVHHDNSTAPKPCICGGAAAYCNEGTPEECPNMGD